MVLKMKILSFESASHSRAMELTVTWVPRLLPLTSPRNLTPEDGLVCQYPTPLPGLIFPVSTSYERKDVGGKCVQGAGGRRGIQSMVKSLHDKLQKVSPPNSHRDIVCSYLHEWKNQSGLLSTIRAPSCQPVVHPTPQYPPKAPLGWLCFLPLALIFWIFSLPFRSTLPDISPSNQHGLILIPP